MTDVKDQIIHGDCLEVMPTLEDKSVDMVLADLPYGVTACKWDTPIDLNALWVQWLRICNGAIVLTGTQPFTSRLVISQPKLFKYEWIWDKGTGTNFLLSRKMPLKRHENILVFYNGVHNYNPQMVEREDKSNRWRRKYSIQRASSEHIPKIDRLNTERALTGSNKLALPHTLLKFSNKGSNQFKKTTHHPTQKPVALFEYLIRTYTNEGDTVLDPTCGSGTTAVACRESNRHFICIEKEQEYCDIANKRISEML